MDKTGVSKGLGSIDISAAVRSILQVMADFKDKGLKRVSHIKSNIAAKGKPFGYRLDEGIFSWIPDVGEPDDNYDETANETQRACDFLNEILKDGSLQSTLVDEQAKEIAISKSTLNRAKKRIGVRARQIKEGQKILWWEIYLPNTPIIGKKPVSQHNQDAQYSPLIHYNDPESYRAENTDLEGWVELIDPKAVKTDKP